MTVIKTLPVSQHICLLTLFLTFWWHVRFNKITTQQLLLIDALLLCMAFLFSMRHVTLKDLLAPTLRILQGAIPVIGTLWILSPCIQTLTQTVSDDTLFVLTSTCLIIHIALHEYNIPSDSEILNYDKIAEAKKKRFRMFTDVTPSTVTAKKNCDEANPQSQYHIKPSRFESAQSTSYISNSTDKLETPFSSPTNANNSVNYGRGFFVDDSQPPVITAAMGKILVAQNNHRIFTSNSNHSIGGLSNYGQKSNSQNTNIPSLSLPSSSVNSNNNIMNNQLASCDPTSPQPLPSISIPSPDNLDIEGINAVALNATVFASVLLASRLEEPDAVFAFILLGLLMFVSNSLFRKDNITLVSTYKSHQSGAAHGSPNNQENDAKGFFRGMKTYSFIFCLFLLCLISLHFASDLLAWTFAFIVPLITFGGPLWFIRYQKNRYAIQGPWDTAHVDAVEMED